MIETTVGPFHFRLQSSLTLAPPPFTAWPLLLDESGQSVGATMDGRDTFLIVDHRSNLERRAAHIEFWTTGEDGEGSLRGMFVLSDPVIDVCRPCDGWSLGEIADLLSSVPAGM
ncbi:MAG: hypothetical protein HY875_09040 [Chloroflexi bacterium]|nr:hypothetical protein [Chloroflexota bacterium]